MPLKKFRVASLSHCLRLVSIGNRLKVITYTNGMFTGDDDALQELLPNCNITVYADDSDDGYSD